MIYQFITIYVFKQANMGTDASKACWNGEVVYNQYGYKSDIDNSYSFNLNDKISSITTRSCRILHGSVSWLASAVKLGIGDPIEHWWTTIRTRNGNYYQLQFRGPCDLIQLRKCSSSRSCDLNGLCEANKTTDADIWTEKSYCYTYSNTSTYTIGDIVRWMKTHEFSAKYSLISHNCQDLCKAFYTKLYYLK